MAKVLLINSNRFRHPWPVIPFGLCYVASVLEATGNHYVHFLDLCFSKNCREDIQQTIRDFVPDVIGISVRNIDDTGGYNVRFLLEDVKNDVIDNCVNQFPGPIIIGGPAIGISGKEILEYFDLEYAVCGDGELVMAEFVQRIENKLPPDGLKGLIIRRDKSIIQDNGPTRIKDLDSLPFPKPQKYLDLNNYRRLGSPLLIQTKRGCGFTCSYCTYNQIEGKTYRLRNPALIADEIEILVKETGIKHIEFADSIFNVPLAHSKEVLKAVINKKLSLKLHTMGLTPAAIDEELIDLMKSAGFNEVDIGVESVSDKILKDLSKDFTREDVIKTADLLKKKKIPATWFIILGAPSETHDTILGTLNSIRKIISKWDLVFISTGIRIYNGSPYATEALKQMNHCTDDNFLNPVKINPVNISLEDIHKIAAKFAFRNPNFYFYEINNITPGWQLISGNFLLKFFHSRQPVWRLLILLKRIELFTGISMIKRGLYWLKSGFGDKKIVKENGFSLIHVEPKSA